MSEYDLTDKVAIVTGGAGGIGTAICAALAKANAKVVVSSRNQERIESVVADLKAIGADAAAVAADVTKPDQVAHLLHQTVDAFGRIDTLVNNAGGAVVAGKPEEISLEGWNATVALNLTGTFLCATAAAKVMIEQNGGKIINISSNAGFTGPSNMAPYAAAKAGVIGLTVSLANAWAEHSINVNCIAPGWVATPWHISSGAIPSREKPDGSVIPPLLYAAEPEAVADLTVFLASAASDHISGECIPIKGRHS